jgi:bleomycin hydrolase
MNSNGGSSFVFFFDKLEKANYFLEQNIELADMAPDSRLIQTLYESPVNDGGQWDMYDTIKTHTHRIINIITKYGIVPQSAFPETINSSASSDLNWIITKKLREFGIALRAIINASGSVSQARIVKQTQLAEIYRILATTLAIPPTTFDWEFTNAKGEFYRFTDLTPVRYYNEFIRPSLSSGEGVSGMVSLVNDPRHEYYREMTVEHLGNVHGGQAVRYLNVPIEDMKDVAMRLLIQDRPVWFGCDVGQFFDGAKGIMDLDAFEYGSAFKTDVVTSSYSDSFSGT